MHGLNLRVSPGTHIDSPVGTPSCFKRTERGTRGFQRESLATRARGGMRYRLLIVSLHPKGKVAFSIFTLERLFLSIDRYQEMHARHTQAPSALTWFYRVADDYARVSLESKERRERCSQLQASDGGSHGTT